MKIVDPTGFPREEADGAHFTGRATLTRMTGVSEQPQVNAYRVTFEPGSRTAWHTHSGVQILLVTAGRCRLQKSGEPVRLIPTGGLACILPDEKHWHGAEADGAMTHIALNIDATTTWLDKVTESEYSG